MANESAAVTPWLVRPVPKDRASLRLFVFPYAGAGGAAFRPWAPLVPADVELCLVQLPGRESRWKEPPFTRMTELLPPLLAGLRPYLDRSYMFYGHSLGGLIAFELARALRRASVAGPAHLFASAHRAPQCPNPHPPMRHLADGPFVDEIMRRYGGIPQPVLDSPELMALMLPCLRADFNLFETYEFADEPPLSCPISAFGGLGDAYVTLDALQPWSAQTTGAFNARMFAGDHFFVQGSRAQVVNEVIRVLAAVPRSAQVGTIT